MLTQPNTDADRPNALRLALPGVRRMRAHPDGDSAGLRAGGAGRAGQYTGRHCRTRQHPDPDRLYPGGRPKQPGLLSPVSDAQRFSEEV